MEPDQGGTTPPSEEPKPPQPQQSVSATGGSSIRDVVQLSVGGDFIYADKLYTRTELDELEEYLKRAVATYEARMYQALAPRPISNEPYKELEPFTLEDAQMFFGRDAEIDELYRKVINNRLTIMHARSGAGKTSMINAGLSPRLIGEARLPFIEAFGDCYGDPTLPVRFVIALRQENNVQEWTSTEIPFEVLAGLVKPKFSNAPLSMEEALKYYYPVVSLRGGSWDSVRSLAFASQRRSMNIDQKYTQIGFRCVCPDVRTSESAMRPGIGGGLG